MSTYLEIPTVTKPIQLEMTDILYAEGRIDEIAIVNTQKAPELMSCFVKAYTRCTEYLTNISAEAVKARNAVDFRRAEIILEEVPRILKEKGLLTGKTTGGNEDQRNAVMAMDKKYIELRDQLERIEMYVELFKGKQKSIEMQYMAVRKILGAGIDFRNPNLGSSWGNNITPDNTHIINPSLPYTPFIIKIGDEPPQTTTGSAIPTTNPLRAGFGKSKD